MTEKSNLKSYKKLQDFLDNLEVSESFSNIADELFEQAHEEELYYGKDVEEFAAGIVYNTNKLVDCEFNCNKISSELDVSKETVLKSGRDINKELGLKVGAESIESYYEQIKDKLDVSEEVSDEAYEIIQVCKEASLHSGKSRNAFVGSAFYSASKLNGGKLTQNEIAEVSGISTVTLRKQYREQLNEYEEDN